MTHRVDGRARMTTDEERVPGYYM